MRRLAIFALTASVVLLAGCSGGSTIPTGLVLTWNANGTSGNQYQTLHLATGASALLTTTQDATRQNFTVFLSGGVPNGTAPGSGPATPSSACNAFAVGASATTASSEQTVTATATGTCYLVAYDTIYGYTQLQIADP